jgi:hypothetical protein
MATIQWGAHAPDWLLSGYCNRPVATTSDSQPSPMRAAADRNSASFTGTGTVSK